MDQQTLPQENRIKLIDAIRGFAVFGILLMNVPFFAHAYQIHFNINVLGEYSGPNYWCWKIVNFFFEGTMRGLFSILFGAGALLLLDRLEKKENLTVQPADIYYRRLIWLFIFGLINAFIFLWPGDILYAYSLCGLFLFPFRNLKAIHFMAFSLVFLLCSTAQHTYKLAGAASLRENGIAAEVQKNAGKKLSDESKIDLEKWEEYREKQSISAIRNEVEFEIKSMKVGYLETFKKMSHVNAYIQSKEMYNEYFFDALTFFFLGMALFKYGFLSGNRPISHSLLLSAGGYAIGLTVNYFWMKEMVKAEFDLARLGQNIGVSYYQIKRMGITLGHLGFLISMYQSGILSPLYKWMANVGQMAFTNYLMQSLIGAFVFHGYGLALYGQLERYEWYKYVACVWVFQLIFSQIWMHFFRFGPFEWIWRSLTWWQIQPLRRIQKTQ